MGLSSCQSVHAGHRHAAGCRHDSGSPRRKPGANHGRACAGLTAALFGAIFACAAMADVLRIATYNAELAAGGPGLLLQDLNKGDVPKHRAVVEVLAALDADVVMLTGIDFDLGGLALSALNDQLSGSGKGYPYLMALRPNTGIPTGLDIDGNGQLGEPRDAQGWGRFAGSAGMAVLSRLPIGEGVRDFSGFLWADLPGNLMPDTDVARGIQRLHTSGAYEIPLLLPDGRSLRLLTYYASPPVFDGPEDRNGRRNHDETAFWLRLLAGDLPFAVPEPPFVILGQSNADPSDGDGRPDAIRALLKHPALQDPAPKGTHARAEPDQRGDPALDTALYGGLGGLRVEVLLPSANLTVTSSGVLWPPASDPLAATLALASRHRPLWVDAALP